MLREADVRQGTGARSKRAQSVVVVSEVALSLVLLIGATLLIRTFVSSSKVVQPGFDSHHVVLMTMPLHGGHNDTAAGVTSMVRDARRALAAVPGVESSAATFSAPYASRMGLPFTSVSRNSTVSDEANGWQFRLGTSAF